MEIYAEISRKILQDIESNGNTLSLPYGISMSRKNGSRACTFECSSGNKEDLIDFLDNKGISWQIQSEDIQEEEKVSKRKGMYKDFSDRWGR